MSRTFKWVLAFFILVETSQQETISTVQGNLNGIRHEGFVSYIGIPYANISSTGGRFKRAGLAPIWSGTREPQPLRSSCSDIEQCLLLDVHVPNGDAGSEWNVLVWVKSGSGRYHPDMLVKQGIIVVNVHYRHGPLGFLCLNHEKVPGNAGAKDLVLALRWVRDNIVAFRGAPTKVVVAGQSFGAAVVEALMLSPMGHGLFHGVILQSGSALSLWAYNYDAQDRAKKLASEFTESEDQDDVASALLDVNVDDLSKRAEELQLAYFPFGICKEQAFRNEERFLPDTPLELLTNKMVHRVPVIIGYNSNEAYIFASTFLHSNMVKRMSKDLSILLPEELVLNENESKQVMRQIRDTYFRNNNTMAALLTYFRDAYFLQHTHRSVRLHTQASDLPVYYYQFSHGSEPGVDEPGVKKAGAAHSDELAYLFPNRGRILEGEDGVVQDRIVKLWTNFVLFLNPTPSSSGFSQWEPARAGDPEVYSIGSELEMRDYPHSRAMQIWDDIYEKYYFRRQKSGVQRR